MIAQMVLASVVGFSLGQLNEAKCEIAVNVCQTTEGQTEGDREGVISTEIYNEGFTRRLTVVGCR